MADVPPALVRESVERKRLSRKVLSEQRREQVLDRITEVFAKRGYQAATVDHLIAGGKISMGGFYKDFDGKEDCFVQVYDRVIADLKGRIVAAVPPESDWPTAVALGLRTLVEFAGEKPMAARVALVEAQTGGETAVARYSATMAEASAFLRRGRDLAGGEGPPQENFEEATVGGLAWLLQNRLARGRIDEPERLWPDVVRMILEPYVGAARADRVLRDIA